MNNLTIAKEIDYDIERGIYDLFVSEKQNMERIAKKLIKSTYVSNCELSIHDMTTLERNGYI